MRGELCIHWLIPSAGTLGRDYYHAGILHALFERETEIYSERFLRLFKLPLCVSPRFHALAQTNKREDAKLTAAARSD